VLRVFEGDALMREVDCALESRSYYIHGLPDGRRYRVEAFFVDAQGRSRRIGHASNSVQLPNEGPSSDGTVRFLRVPWDLALQRFRELLSQGRVASAEKSGDQRYLSWRRFPLPNSAEGWVGEAGGVVAPQNPLMEKGMGWTPPRSGRPY
jgi:hypothetical protein